ncbi:MAG: hypothetical protein IAG10_07585 [Planctomycetaceae bacterium]|nr:hypothetical protein [Planctomycetaceae bacterium]
MRVTLRRLRIPLPLLLLQQEFALLVSRRERLRAAEHLVQSRFHRAFTTGL